MGEESIYSFSWKEIRRLAPQAVLLRGPACLNPVQAVGHDLDILLPAGSAAVKALLRGQGFCHEYRPEPYLERYQLRLADHAQPYSIDLYKEQRWGLGFRIAGDLSNLPSVRLACLLHAVVDGKGTLYFESVQNGPPWQQKTNSKVSLAGPLGRILWQSRFTGILTMYLLLAGVIRPELSLVLRNLIRRIAFRLWQLKRKPGLEVALLGVDGTGKSSIAKALLSLPAPVKVVYMGDKECTTWVRRLARQWKLPSPIPQLALSYELLLRRVSGWLSSVRGWVVVYDRLPAERFGLRRGSVKHIIKNLIERHYVWPTDLTFWLTGDHAAIHERKKEQTAARLEAMDLHIRDVLQGYSIPFEEIDVTKEDLSSVRLTIANRILAAYRERASVDDLQGVLGAILV